MKRFLFISLVAALPFLALAFSCSPGEGKDDSPAEDVETAEEQGDTLSTETLEGSYYAPDFPQHLDWLNTDRKFSIRDFRGKVVVLDFWTFCCINCMHVIPVLKQLEQKYPEELAVIGVHSAKFTNEQGTEQIRQAILRYGIEHPVVNDKNFEVWREYGTRAWPTLVVINPEGKVIGVNSGEAEFAPFDQLISQTIRYFDKKGELKRGPLDLVLEKETLPNHVLTFPGKVKADPKGKRLFITDSNHNRVIITDPNGKIIDVIGSGQMGQKDGSFEDASFKMPQGTTLDGDILYIADTENHLVRKADLKKRTVETILGTGQQSRLFGVGGTGTDIALNSPWDLLVHDGSLYIAMAGPHQLWKADLGSLYAAPFAGSGREGRADGTLASAALAQPSGITTDGSKLYFADSETSSIRSADYDTSGNVSTIVGEDLFEFGDIDGGADVARLQHPLGIVYKDGLLYVADTYNSKIKIIDPQKRTSTTLAGIEKHGYKDGSFKEAQFFEPSGITALGDSLYVADANNHQIRVLDLNSKIVSTLELSNLDKLAEKAMDNFAGRIEKSEPKKVKPGDGVLTLSVDLEANYKINTEAPLFLEWKSGDNGTIKFDKNGSKMINFPVAIPFHAEKGMTTVTVDAVVYFCEEKNASVCLVDNIRLEIPVEVTEAGMQDLKVALSPRALPM